MLANCTAQQHSSTAQQQSGTAPKHHSTTAQQQSGTAAQQHSDTAEQQHRTQQHRNGSDVCCAELKDQLDIKWAQNRVSQEFGMEILIKRWPDGLRWEVKSHLRVLLEADKVEIGLASTKLKDLIAAQRHSSTTPQQHSGPAARLPLEFSWICKISFRISRYLYSTAAQHHSTAAQHHSTAAQAAHSGTAARFPLGFLYMRMGILKISFRIPLDLQWDP